MTYETLIQPFLWLVFGMATLVFLIRAVSRRRKQRDTGNLFYYAAAGALAAVLVVPSIAWVPAGHRGVIYEWGGGVNPGERGEGITFLAPWVQHMRPINVRTQKVYSAKVFAQSLDLQEITVIASVNYHVEPDRAAELYQEVGPAYRATVIQPALFQRTKAAVGQVRAEDFALSRGKLAETIRDQLTDQLSPYGIVVEFINIEDAVFDPEFVAAVKAKVIAEQEALKQRNLVKARLAVKRQTIIDAEAQKRSILLVNQGQARGNQVLRASLTAEVLRWKWLTRWNGVLPSTLVDGQGATLLLDATSSYSYP